MFTDYPTYSMYRNLKLISPIMRGEDVWAVQSGLIELGLSLPKYGADGFFGSETSQAITAAQKKFGLYVDGICGGQTQRAMALKLVERVNLKYGIPKGALKGQVEHESSYRFGAYSAPHEDGKWDAGLCQENLDEFSAKDAYDPAAALDDLGDRIRGHYNYFAGLSEHRRWALAQGSWNAPAYACYYAKLEGATQVAETDCAKPPTQADADKFNTYVASVTAYLEV